MHRSQVRIALRYGDVPVVHHFPPNRLRFDELGAARPQYAGEVRERSRRRPRARMESRLLDSEPPRMDLTGRADVPNEHLLTNRAFLRLVSKVTFFCRRPVFPQRSKRSGFLLRMSSHTCRQSKRCLTLSDRNDALVVVEEFEERPWVTAQAWLVLIKVMM